MPSTPNVQTLNASSVDILNVIRANASTNYREFIPEATKDAESVKAIGSILMEYPLLQNEFLSALVNRIGRVLITSKMYDNPWSVFKKGMLEFGETIEEVFVNIAKPFQFDPETAENTVFKREIPDVRAAFHIMNYQKFYKATVSNDQLRQAFLSWDGITDLVARIVDSMYTGANYDEFQTMKYMLAINILNGRLYPVTIANVEESNMKKIISKIKGVSNSLEFMSDKYNLAGVQNVTKKGNQHLIINAEFDAVMDVEVLASAFNMSKAEFMGNRHLVDSFGSLDKTRLAILFKDDPNYIELTDEQLEALDAIPAVLVDENYFMVLDNFTNFTEQFNGEGLYWNYWYHVWKTFSVSPFANNAMFISGEPSIDSVAVAPTEATVPVGGTIKLIATVATENFAPQTVTWSSNNANVEVDIDGTVKVKTGATGTAKITATSTFDSGKSGEATITIG